MTKDRPVTAPRRSGSLSRASGRHGCRGGTRTPRSATAGELPARRLSSRRRLRRRHSAQRSLLQSRWTGGRPLNIARPGLNYVNRGCGRSQLGRSCRGGLCRKHRRHHGHLQRLPCRVQGPAGLEPHLCRSRRQQSRHSVDVIGLRGLGSVGQLGSDLGRERHVRAERNPLGWLPLREPDERDDDGDAPGHSSPAPMAQPRRHRLLPWVSSAAWRT